MGGWSGVGDFLSYLLFLGHFGALAAVHCSIPLNTRAAHRTILINDLTRDIDFFL